MPGQFVIMDKQMTLMDLLTMAGGVNDVASDTAYVYRRSTENRSEDPATAPSSPGSDGSGGVGSSGGYEVIAVDINALREGTRIELNLALKGGDVFYVPERKREFFYVVGDVGHPGAYEIPQGEQLLASQAISYAGGPIRTAKMGDGILVRQVASGSREELKVDFAAILKGKAPDFPVRAEDLIFVPGSTAKTIGYGLLGIIPGLAQNAVVYGPQRH